MCFVDLRFWIQTEIYFQSNKSFRVKEKEKSNESFHAKEKE